MAEIKKVLKIPAIIQKVETMSDKGLKLTVHTQEIGPEDAADVMLLRDKIGVFVFAEQDIKMADMKDLPKIELEAGEKAPSARLRAVLYVYWEQHKVQEPFDTYYRRQMEKFIGVIKEKLD